MGGFTLLIADSDDRFCKILSLMLQESYYVRTCSTGAQALALLRESPADILMANLFLPEIDGLTLIQTLAREGSCPPALVIAPDFPPQACAALERLDICHLIRTPCRLSSIAEKLEQIRKVLESQTILQLRTRQILQQLEMIPKYDGYPLLLEVLPSLAEDPQQTFTKHLYPDAAKLCRCRSKQVERNIRTIIEKSWNCNSSVWKHYFPRCTKRPSNGLFLKRIALELRKNLE